MTKIPKFINANGRSTNFLIILKKKVSKLDQFSTLFELMWNFKIDFKKATVEEVNARLENQGFHQLSDEDVIFLKGIKTNKTRILNKIQTTDIQYEHIARGRHKNPSILEISRLNYDNMENPEILEYMNTKNRDDFKLKMIKRALELQKQYETKKEK